jgi:DNA-binding response OmpR family regulator
MKGSASMKLLIVEDNIRLAERLHYKLGKEFVIDVVHSGDGALSAAHTYTYDVIILDIGLPDISGLEVCQRLRAMKIHTPILILSGLHTVPIRVELLSAGADDYVTKPFDIAEVRARILALERRHVIIQPTTRYSCGLLRVNLEEHTVVHGDNPILLRRKEFDILAYLLKNQGRIVTRQMIMDNVWSGDTNSWLSTIDVHIKHIRDKVDRPFETHYIKTAYGIGYKVDES